MRAPGRTQARLRGLVCCGAPRCPSPERQGLWQRQPRGKVGGSEGVGLGLARAKVQSAPALAIFAFSLLSGCLGSCCGAGGLEEPGAYFQLRLSSGM